jgi:hypothetical protein
MVNKGGQNMNHQSNQCPKSVASALAKVQANVKTMGFDSNNAFAKYKYVSIDKYYDVVRPLLVDAGLMIIPDEEESDISDDRKVYKTRIKFTILHESGEYWDFPIRRTVILPFTGAQSCGSALSYAEKFCMRTLFKMTTGEEDADALAPQDFSALTDDQRQKVKDLMEQATLNDDERDKMYKWLKIKDLDDVRPEQYENLVSALKRKISGK